MKYWWIIWILHKLLPFGPINSLGTFQVSANWGISTQCSFFVNAFGIELLTISPTQWTWSPPVVQNMADKTFETALVVVWKIHFVTCFCWCFPISRIRGSFCWIPTSCKGLCCWRWSHQSRPDFGACSNVSSWSATWFCSGSPGRGWNQRLGILGMVVAMVWIYQCWYFQLIAGIFKI